MLTRNISLTLHLQLRFIINLAKSSLIPSQVIMMVHLGALMDTLKGMVKPTLDKVQQITQVSQAGPPGFYGTPPAGSRPYGSLPHHRA